NYYIFIPLYSKFLFPASAMIEAASKINPGVKDISTYILYAIMPFNLIKGVVVSIITLLMYKKVSPILHK
ncbi:MAG TPA: ECF transporter S component, partial [Clostridiaceae bacterium]|nr:ECF transporter S component [Clostridiaceae bacterium]